MDEAMQMDDEMEDDALGAIREQFQLAATASDEYKVLVGSAGYFAVMQSIEALSLTKTNRLAGFTNRLRADKAVNATLPGGAIEMINILVGDREISPATALVISTAMVLVATFVSPSDQVPQQEVKDEEIEFVDE